jgi:alkanesulfonate monooxygenase SsuD/methylene tetrahydromethanopterin reductase-like flavin-dependent oxidoreductase (luciferase family)
MELGLFFDLRNPPGWQVDNTRLYRFTLEVIEEAERLGVHSIWVSEHHLFEDGYLPQPLTFLAAAAARTNKIRLGTAILLSAFRSAAQIAEEAAIVDIISGGRLEIGLGAGYRVPEFALFNADFESRFKTNDQRARELRKLWAEKKITPMPVQPRLPLWMGYQTNIGARRAGRLGERLLCPNAALWPSYRDGLMGWCRAGSAMTRKQTGPSSRSISPIKSTATSATASRVRGDPHRQRSTSRNYAQKVSTQGRTRS